MGTIIGFAAVALGTAAVLAVLALLLRAVRASGRSASRRIPGPEREPHSGPFYGGNAAGAPDDPGGFDRGAPPPGRDA